jgi:hypothetical protein
LSVTGASAASIKSTQTFVVTEGQTVFTVTGGYTPGLMDIFVNGVYLSPNQTTATNGTTFTINDPAATGDIVDIIVSSPIFEGSASTTDQLPEGVVNLYYTNARARAAITLTTTGVSGAATYNSSTGVFNIPNYQGLVPAGGVAGDILAKVSGTNYDVTWIPNYTSQVQHIVKAAVAVTKGQAVYVSSADGTNMIVSKASNASEQTSSKTLGLVAQDLAINGQGFVVTEGLLAGLNTSTANAGDPVWLGTDGNLIFGLLNKPTAPAHLVFIGVVTRVQQNNGEIFVKVQNGFELDELHDLSVKNPSDGDMIKYVASTGLWTKVAASTTNIVEGTNLYYTQGRFDTAFAAKSTTNLAEGTNLYYTDARVGTYLTNNSYATQTYVNTAVSNLVDAAPGTLDTLNELAAALGDDPNFATTVATSIGTKEPAITAGTTSQYWRGDKTWQTLPVYTLSGLGGVPTTRSLTINGTAYDLSADRSWTINSMVYPEAGIPLSTGTAWGTSITNNSANWNTAYGWGNHATAGYLTGITSSQVTNALGFTPYNAAGNTVLTNVNYASYALRWNSTQAPANGLDNTSVVPNSVTLFDGYGAAVPGYPSGAAQWWVGALTIGDANRGFQIAGGYADGDMYFRKGNTTWSSWKKVWTDGNLTNLSQLTNGPGYLTSITSSQVTTALGYTPYNATNPNGYISSYTETDTLASVTSRGSSTSTTLNLDGRVNIGNGLTRPSALNSDSAAHARIGGADVHLYVASLGAGGGYKVAVQSARTSDFQSFGLDLQSNGGTLYYGGNEVATKSWVSSQSYITGYTETDTLSSVVARGASTTATITVGAARTALKAASGMSAYGVGNWVSDFTNTPISSMTFGEDKYDGGPAGTWWFQVNMRHQNSGNIWGTQLAYGWEDNANRIMQRNVTGGTWSGWVEYLNSSNYTSWVPTKTGSGASGTWGISITGSANSASTATSASYLTGGDSSAYMLLYNALSGNLNDYNSPGLYSAEYTGSTNRPVGQNGSFIQISDAGGTDVKTQWYYQSDGAGIYMRLMWGNGSWRAWRTLITDSNIGSQSVSYASTAGSANSVAWGNVSGRPSALSQFSNDSGYITSSGSISGSAAQFAGYGTGSFEGNFEATINASGLDANTYYPVTIGLPTNRLVKLSLRVALNSNAPSWSTHPSGFSVKLIWYANGNGWGTNDVVRYIESYNYRFVSGKGPIGGIQQLSNSSEEVVWVRGGGIYYCYSSHPVNWTLRTSSYDNYGPPYTQNVTPTTAESINDIWSTTSGRVSYGEIYTPGALISNYRLQLPNMTMGYWDGANNRIEGGSDRPLLITSYNTLKLGISGSANWQMFSNGQTLHGTGTTRSTYGHTIALSLSSAVYSENSDIGDGGRFLSIVNEYTGSNAFSALSFRINPAGAGGTGNAMMDMKVVNTGNTTSNLHYTFLDSGNWRDRLTLKSTGQLVIKQASTADTGYDNPLWIWVAADADAIVIQNTTSGGTAPKIYFRDTNGIIQTGNSEIRLRTSNSNSLSAYLNGGTWNVTGDVVAYASDKRLKENIKPISNSLNKLLSLSGVTFDWNSLSEKAGFIAKRKYNEIGVLAQDVEAVIPQAVEYAPFDRNSDGTSISGENYLTVKYEKIVPLLIEAVKEQQVQIESQKTEIEELKDLVKQLINR